MIREDARAKRVAIVADILVNPQAAFYAGIAVKPASVMDVLLAGDWGIMKLPPHVLGERVGGPAAATIAGDAADYLRHGYAVAIIAVEGLEQGGVWLDELSKGFRELGTPVPQVISVGAGGNHAELRAALAAAVAVR